MAALTLLEIIKEHCRRAAVPVPNNAVANSDVNVTQMVGLMQELLEDLLKRKIYQQITKEATWVSTAAEDQGSIYTIADGGFVSVIPDTFFDRSRNLRVTFGMTPQEWQARKATAGVSGPAFWARLRQDKLLFSPTPPAGDTFAFEYRSSWFVKSTLGVAKERWSADTDLLVLPDTIGIAWLRWKWKEEKGFDYAESFRHYEELITGLALTDGGPRPVDLARTRDAPQAGVVIPVGSWVV